MPHGPRMRSLSTYIGAESQTCKVSVEMPNKQGVYMQQKQNQNRSVPTLVSH